MKLPANIIPPFRFPDRGVLTAAFWVDVRDGAFSLAGVTSMTKEDPQLRVEEECRTMTKRAAANGADQEFCDVFCRIYEAFFWEGMACVKTAKVATR